MLTRLVTAVLMVIAGAAVADAAVAAQQAGLIGGEKGFIKILGRVFASVRFDGACQIPAGVGQAPVISI